MIISMVYFSLCFVFTLFSVSQSGYLTIFKDADFKGDHLNFVVDNNGSCYTLPILWEDETSSVLTGGACVDLYSERNCKGKKHIRLFPGSFSHHNLTRWNFDNKLKSISVCEKLIDETNYQVEGNTVVVWEDKDYKGEFLNVNVDYCENLPVEWRNRISGTDTFGKCYKFYSELDCNGQHRKLSAGSPSRADFSEWGFDGVTKSIGVCRPSTSLHQKQTASGTATEKYIANGFRTEMVALMVVISTTIRPQL